jgi:hypothetical protein
MLMTGMGSWTRGTAMGSELTNSHQRTIHYLKGYLKGLKEEGEGSSVGAGSCLARASGLLVGCMELTTLVSSIA